jgi:hypothetical protein
MDECQVRKKFIEVKKDRPAWMGLRKAETWLLPGLGIFI